MVLGNHLEVLESKFRKCAGQPAAGGHESRRTLEIPICLFGIVLRLPVDEIRSDDPVRQRGFAGLDNSKRL